MDPLRMPHQSSADILIPTNSRPGVLRRLLASVERIGLPVSFQVIVVNSTPAGAPRGIREDYDRIAREFDIRLEAIEENAGPGRARSILTEISKAPLLMFLDDDHVLTPSSLKLFDHIARKDVDIASGLWLETESRAVIAASGPRPAIVAPEEVLTAGRIPVQLRPAGQLFADGTLARGVGDAPADVLIRTSVHLKPLSDLTLRVDGCMPTLLAKRSVFEWVSFDPGYGFYFEWLDFFMQCRRAGIRPLVDTSALFWHLPSFYATKTARTISPRDRDECRFVEKWGRVPVFADERQVRLGRQGAAPVRFLRKLAYRITQREG
jgi:hypothetical protein